MTGTLKGAVLAAGLGTRLRPLTERLPKPLVPFCGTTPLALALWRLKQAGIEQVAVNAHYHAPQIERVVKENPFDQEIYYSYEPEILGTGGVYNALKDWLGDSDLVVYNGDLVSDMNVSGLVETHRKTGALATMAMLPEVIPGENGFFCNGQGQLVGFGKQGPQDAVARNFACVQVLTRAFLDTLPRSGSFGIIEEGYLPALKRGAPLFSYLHQGFWHDLRTPYFYFEALRDFLKLSYEADPTGIAEVRRRLGLRTLHLGAGESFDLPYRARGPILLDESCAIGRNAEIGPDVILEPGASVGEGAVVRSAVILKGAVVPAKACIEGRIFGPGVDIPVRDQA